MRITIAILCTALLASCGIETSRQQAATASLTLNMEETEVGGEPATVMMLCEKEKCVNPLRDRSGKHFYFKNYADLYNQKVEEEGKGQKIKMALLGVTMVATAAGAALYIKSDAMRWRIVNLKDKIKELSERVAKKTKKNNLIEADKANKELEELKAERQKLQTIDAVVAPTYWGMLGLSALGTNALAFAPGIAEDTLWQNNKNKLADLFIHGSEVKVTKDELIDLFSILSKQVNATVDVAVQTYLFGI